MIKGEWVNHSMICILFLRLLGNGCSSCFVVIIVLYFFVQFSPIPFISVPFLIKIYVWCLTPFQTLIRVETLTALTKASAMLLLPGIMLVSAEVTAHRMRNKSVVPTVALSRTCVSSKKRFVKHAAIIQTIILEAVMVWNIVSLSIKLLQNYPCILLSC